MIQTPDFVGKNELPVSTPFGLISPVVSPGTVRILEVKG